MAKEFRIDGIDYMETAKGYYFKVEDGKKTRIKKQEFEDAFEDLCNRTDEQLDLYVDESGLDADVDQWMQEIDEAREAHEQEQAESDKQAEDAVNGKKKAKKRKSKDIALELDGLTLTAKQVDLMKHFPDTSFWEHGLDSAPWIDVLMDEIGGQFAGKPMTVGALLSTLKEKGIIYIDKERVNGHNAKYFCLTELGRKIATEIGLA